MTRAVIEYEDFENFSAHIFGVGGAGSGLVHHIISCRRDTAAKGAVALNEPIIIMTENRSRRGTSSQVASEARSMFEVRLSAPCPKCRTEMVYAAALPHPKSPTMWKTTFVCYGCNQTRTYALSEHMAKDYAASHGDPLLTINTEPQAP